MKLLILFIFIFVLVPQFSCAQDEYSFDVAEIEKKPYSFGGYIEARPVFLGFDTDAAIYKLKLYDQNEGKTGQEYNAILQLNGSYEKGITKFHTKINSDVQQSYPGWSNKTNIFEGYVSVKPSSAFNFNAGKKTLKWGKGYAWTPVAFLDRIKNPEDPDLALEGVIGLSADYIKSYSGRLKTISFTPVLIPVYDDINDDFGEVDNLNLAGKVYLLLYDTDIDFIILTGGSKNTSYGFDFSKNITSNFELHGEFALVNNVDKKFINSNGDIFVDNFNANNYLLGSRYLSEIDTTYIIEYYHNDTGYTGAQMNDYFSFINQAYDTFLTTGNDSQMKKALSITKDNYGRITPMRDYLYARISQKEPFDILYFTPSIAGIYNINNKSFSLSPEIIYTGITNLELRLKTTFLSGQSNSEYGEKQNDYKIELRGRYYF